MRQCRNGVCHPFDFLLPCQQRLLLVGQRWAPSGHLWEGNGREQSCHSAMSQAHWGIALLSRLINPVLGIPLHYVLTTDFLGILTGAIKVPIRVYVGQRIVPYGSCRGSAFRDPRASHMEPAGVSLTSRVS